MTAAATVRLTCARLCSSTGTRWSFYPRFTAEGAGNRIFKISQRRGMGSGHSG